MKTKDRVIRKGYYSCPKCDNPQSLEVIFYTNEHYDLEICLCGFPETEGE